MIERKSSIREKHIAKLCGKHIRRRALLSLFRMALSFPITFPISIILLICKAVSRFGEWLDNSKAFGPVFDWTYEPHASAKKRIVIIFRKMHRREERIMKRD